MTNIDPNKKIQRIRTEEEIRAALSNFIHRKHTMTVPPQVEDDDTVLYDAFKELLEARKKLALLEPLRDVWISELERRETLRDRGDAWKVIFEPMVPLSPVEAPIRDTDSAIISCEDTARETGNAELARYADLGWVTDQGFVPKSSAMITREEAGQAANAELAPYRSLPTSSFLHQIPVISTQEELREAKRKGAQYIFIANPGDSLKDIEELREPEEDEEEQEIDFSINLEPSIRFTAEVTRREEPEPEFYFE